MDWGYMLLIFRYLYFKGWTGICPRTTAPFARLANTLLKDVKVHETITFLLITLPNIYRFKKFTDTLQ